MKGLKIFFTALLMLVCAPGIMADNNNGWGVELSGRFRTGSKNDYNEKFSIIPTANYTFFVKSGYFVRPQAGLIISGAGQKDDRVKNKICPGLVFGAETGYKFGNPRGASVELFAGFDWDVMFSRPYLQTNTKKVYTDYTLKPLCRVGFALWMERVAIRAAYAYQMNKGGYGGTQWQFGVGYKF
ncbi:MAG: porin family protein [Muribaculaceae bacterium]|nr:porin family protein [Muribaculaceae bacterium]